MMSALLRRLDALAAAGTPARFWLRDDDATSPGPALDRLLQMTADRHIPLTLAVIPEPAGPPLAQRLQSAPHVAVGLHGWAHVNHAPSGEKKQELGRHRPAEAVLDDLRRGMARLAELFPQQILPVLVPPWNRIAPDIVAALPMLGVRALSVYGPEGAGPVPMINTHVDLIDWRGTRGGRDAATLEADLLVALGRRRPVGLLTHHLVHDTPAWAFMRDLFALTADHPGCRWMPLAALLAEASP